MPSIDEYLVVTCRKQVRKKGLEKTISTSITNRCQTTQTTRKRKITRKLNVHTKKRKKSKENKVQVQVQVKLMMTMKTILTMRLWPH